MKKPTVILLFVFQIILLFIFDNIHSVFNNLGQSELGNVKNQCEIISSLLIDKYGHNLSEIKKNNHYFYKIYETAKSMSGNYTYESKNKIFHSITKPVARNKSFVFERDSSTLVSIKKLKKIISIISVGIGVFLIFSAFYLILLFKKPRTKNTTKGINPLQNYLKELKQNEIELKDIVSEQEKRVLNKEELNKNIIDTINAGIILVDKSNKIEIFNTIAQKMFHQSYANAINSKLSLILSNMPDIVDFIQKNNAVKCSSEIEVNNKIYFIDLITLKNIGKLIIIRDETEKRKIERINRENNAFIMFGEMAAFLSHEVRNSLGVIYGYTKTLTSKNEKIKNINREINNLSKMIENFSNFSKPIQINKTEKINLPQVFHKNAEETGLKLKMEKKDTYINSDPALIKSLFSNLFLNSKQAGASELNLDIKDHGQIEITITDNGKGIPKENFHKIWYPFFSTREEGSGMGLAIVKKLISSLKGEISLVKTDAKGTSFKIIFY